MQGRGLSVKRRVGQGNVCHFKNGQVAELAWLRSRLDTGGGRRLAGVRLATAWPRKDVAVEKSGAERCDSKYVAAAQNKGQRIL